MIMVENLMINVSNESWCKGLYLNSFEAKFQASIIREMEKLFHFNYKDIHKYYLNMIDLDLVSHISLIPIVIIEHFIKDSLDKVLKEDIDINLYNHSYDQAFSIGCSYKKAEKYLEDIPLEDIDLDCFIYKYKAIGENEFVVIDNVEYDFLNSTTREIVKKVILKAIAENIKFIKGQI